MARLTLEPTANSSGSTATFDGTVALIGESQANDRAMKAPITC